MQLALFKKIIGKINTQFGFYLLVVFLFWLKTYVVYNNEFTLGISGGFQRFLAIINPLPTAFLLFGIALYFRGKIFYWIIMIIDILESMWLFSNILYYREFSDFISMSIIKSSGSVSNNLSLSISQIIHPTDFLVFLDIVILLIFLFFKRIKIDKKGIKIRYAFLLSGISVVFMGANLMMAEKDRSQLLTRTFDNNYIVKYLGLNFYAGYSGYQAYRQEVTKSKANKQDVTQIVDYLKKNKVADNIEYFGKAKGKNIIIFHLESLQQFLINYKLNGKEVTPAINKMYSDKNTLSFDNFFNQVGQGKTSDAEIMLETSLFGLPSGSAMSTYGSTNTFNALPAMLDQRNYSTAAFHGDVGSFWNRDSTYKSWGYQYYFSKPYYTSKEDYNIGYGLKDKIFLKQSAKYLEQLPQPFYSKIITLTNHYPYELDKKNQTIEPTKTKDNTVDGYVQTARYLDESFSEFIDYLKKSGLYDNTMIVMYGDHYGISNNHKEAIAQLLDKKKVSSYDLAMFQKVPFMIHMKNLKGGINHTYGGEIDVMPTLLDLIGIKDNNYLMFGQDLLASNRKQTVIFRNGDFTSPKFTKVGSVIYNAKGEDVTNSLSQSDKIEIKEQQNYATNMLSMSDKVITGDLFRFYKPSDFKNVNRSQYNYNVKEGIKKLKIDQNEKTSLKEKNNGKSTTNLYETDAPELK